MREPRFSREMKMKSSPSLMSIDKEKSFSKREELRTRRVMPSNWKI
jgi:hypothetical protein